MNKGKIEKRIIVSILAMAMALSMTACGGNDAAPSSSTEESSATSSENTSSDADASSEGVSSEESSSPDGEPAEGEPVEAETTPDGALTVEGYDAKLEELMSGFTSEMATMATAMQENAEDPELVELKSLELMDSVNKVVSDIANLVPPEAYQEAHTMFEDASKKVDAATKGIHEVMGSDDEAKIAEAQSAWQEALIAFQNAGIKYTELVTAVQGGAESEAQSSGAEGEAQSSAESAAQ